VWPDSAGHRVALAKKFPSKATPRPFSFTTTHNFIFCTVKSTLSDASTLRSCPLPLQKLFEKPSKKLVKSNPKKPVLRTHRSATSQSRQHSTFRVASAAARAASSSTYAFQLTAHICVYTNVSSSLPPRQAISQSTPAFYSNIGTRPLTAQSVSAPSVSTPPNLHLQGLELPFRGVAAWIYFSQMLT
jgi:hypothetical protein